MNTFWIALAVLDGIALVAFFGSRNAVWGGLTLGALIGLLVAGGFAVFGGDGFRWVTVAKWAIGCSLYGAATEVHAALGRRKNQ